MTSGLCHCYYSGMDPRKRAADAYGAFSDASRKEQNTKKDDKRGEKRRQRDADTGGKGAGDRATGDGFHPFTPPRMDAPVQSAYRASGAGAERGEEEYQSRRESSGFFRSGFGPKKAAKLLLLLGKEQAAQVLRHLEQNEIEKITAEIATIKRIEKAEAKKILEEFGSISRGAREIRGGTDVAREILYAGVGEEKGKAILRKVSPDEEDRPFSFLEELDYQQIMMLVRKEPPHVVSIILAYMKPAQSSQVLESFPPEKQKDIVKRLAKMGRVAPEVLSSIEEKLKERLRTQGKVVTEDIEGERVLAEILRNMNVSDEERILGSLEGQNSQLAESVRERLFTVDALPEVPDYDMQKVLRDFDDRELAIVLKGKSPEVEQKIMRNLSSRRQELVAYERQYLGRMKRAEVEEATGDFLRYLREQAERGEISLREDEYLK